MQYEKLIADSGKSLQIIDQVLAVLHYLYAVGEPTVRTVVFIPVWQHTGLWMSLSKQIFLI